MAAVNWRRCQPASWRADHSWHSPYYGESHRRYRASRSGIREQGYVDRQTVIDEMRAANHYYYQRGYHVVDTTDKPIETSAEEIISLITRRKVTS